MSHNKKLNKRRYYNRFRNKYTTLNNIPNIVSATSLPHNYKELHQSNLRQNTSSTVINIPPHTWNKRRNTKFLTKDIKLDTNFWKQSSTWHITLTVILLFQVMIPSYHNFIFNTYRGTELLNSPSRISWRKDLQYNYEDPTRDINTKRDTENVEINPTLDIFYRKLMNSLDNIYGVDSDVYDLTTELIALHYSINVIFSCESDLDKYFHPDNMVDLSDRKFVMYETPKQFVIKCKIENMSLDILHILDSLKYHTCNIDPLLGKEENKQKMSCIYSRIKNKDPKIKKLLKDQKSLLNLKIDIKTQLQYFPECFPEEPLIMQAVCSKINNI